MITSSIKYGLFGLWLLLPAALFSQDAVEWQPELSLTWQPRQRWQVNLKVVTYHGLAERESGSLRGALSTAHLEWALTGTYRLLGGSSLSLSYAFRLRAPFDASAHIEDRITWQYALIQRAGKYRIGHRFRAEQRFRPGTLIHRWRYRLSLDFPLNGEKIDNGELYFKSSEEVLWSLRDGRPPEGENRLGGGLGWKISEGTKIELLIDYRLGLFPGAQPRHRLVGFSSCYFNL